MSLEKKHEDRQLQTKSTLELYLHGFSLHEIQWEGKSIPQTLNANYLYVASIESLSNVDSPQLRVIQNSLPSSDLLSCGLQDIYFRKLSFCSQAGPFLLSREAFPTSVLFFRQHKFLDCYLVTFTDSQFHFGINNLY